MTGSFDRGREVDAVGLVLGRMAADADAESEATAARLLERRGHPREDRRVAVHDVGDECPDGQPLGHHRRRGQCRPRLEDRVRPNAAADEMVPAPDTRVTRSIEPAGAVEPSTTPIGRLADEAATSSAESSAAPLMATFS